MERQAAGGRTPQGVGSLVRLLRELADTKYRLGQHLADRAWMGPGLEASVASAALSQSQFGRARILHWLVDELEGRRQEGDAPLDAAVREPAEALPVLAPAPETWPEVIAALYGVTAATIAVLEGLVAGPDPVFRSRLRKMLEEERQDALYAEGWVESLLAESGRLPALTREALQRILRAFRRWLAGGDRAGAAAGLVPPGYRFERALEAQVAGLAGSQGPALARGDAG
jgi:1,2-phenylacetyl-CoA epoxidase catalytic subunit